MGELDTGRLISETHKIVGESKNLCDRSRRAVKESERIQDRLAHPRLDRARRKRLLAK